MDNRPLMTARVPEDAGPPQPCGSETDGRLRELEWMFLNLVKNVEDLTDRNAALCRWRATVELERIVEQGVTP